MVNKPCARVCARSAQSRLPSTYRSRSAGSLPRRRVPPNHNYAQYLFNTDEEFADLEKELKRPAVIQVIFLFNSLTIMIFRKTSTKWTEESGYKKFYSTKSFAPNLRMLFKKTSKPNLRNH